ncbi:ureidoglycolate lyase [Starkeya sp. ORNL1]|uniref:ureidoglycolate lyase n=1 Tax=Starkeya sp. ORNL1 TaxID=2709380 RepID=UPI0014630039|nr:ureidoglycolate lyase [Starkeya sp. ORNL1]QJP12344.1 ureidoglycolate lyase [Starkeya sp. ORNL1]
MNTDSERPASRKSEMHAGRRKIRAESLARDAFAPFGDVIDDTGPTRFPTNGGDAMRIHQLAIADCAAERGRTLLSLFRVARPTFHDPLRLMERHPISSQAFVPLGHMRFIAVVAEASKDPQVTNLRAFISNGRQGVNYRRATWHHPLITLDAGDFLVVDRAAPGVEFIQDYEEVVLTDEVSVILP